MIGDMSAWAIGVVGLAVGLGVGVLVVRFVSRPLQRDIRRSLEEARASREEVRGGLERLGEMLRSTLDLEGILSVVLDTAAVTLGARAGALFMLVPSGRGLRLEVARGFDSPEGATLRLGEGIAGGAAGGEPVLLRGPDPGMRSAIEPPARTAVAVPLIRGNRTMGVLALYGRGEQGPFERGDVETLRSFAGQASIAIENVLLHEETKRLAVTDPLTGVANRRSFARILRREIERAHRFDRPLSMLMVDIDLFKEVNDEHGHPRGDEVLITLTRRILGAIRTQIDTFARYGGEEFVVVLPETDDRGARVVAEKVRRVVGDRPFEAESGPALSLTVSVGVATYPRDGGTVEELVAAADLALYRAKTGGRNRVEAGLAESDARRRPPPN